MCFIWYYFQCGFVFQGKVNLPSRWDKIPAGQNAVAVQVKAGSDEFTTVEKSLKASAQNMVTSVVKVPSFLF